MNLYLRVLWVLILSYFKPKLSSAVDTSVLRLKVLPNDLDFNMHMNNGRYFTIMDLGRFDLIMRSGLLKVMIKQKSVPILASAQIRYRLPLMPFQSFDLQTRIVAWDDKWAYMEQKFILVDGPKKGAIAAIALVKGSFYDNKNRRALAPAEVLGMANMTMESPDMEAHLHAWQTAEDALRAVTVETTKELGDQ